jgi:Cof subfamily protein (haloacid dehalogenase superfamily)
VTIRLVATDLDDTLLRDDWTLSERVVQAIRKAREKGVHITFATGRMPASTRPYVKQLGIDVPIITYNGAMIQEALSGEVLYRRVIPVETAREVVSWLLAQELHLHVYREDKVFAHTMNDWSRDYARATRVPVEEANLLELLDQEKDGVEKILFFGENKDLEAWGERILERYRGKVHTTRSKPHFLELIHPEVNKGVALTALAKRLGINREDVMAIGDNLNDIDMIRYAGLGVAIGNARKEVKEAADVITASNQEDGVAQAIEKYILCNEE